MGERTERNPDAECRTMRSAAAGLFSRIFSGSNDLASSHTSLTVITSPGWGYAMLCASAYKPGRGMPDVAAADSQLGKITHHELAVIDQCLPIGFEGYGRGCLDLRCVSLRGGQEHAKASIPGSSNVNGPVTLTSYVDSPSDDL
eukprot:CAMPEP_0201905762 /NCGR_PEP_ID=MMETSP0902-20130614/56675_1 /ASSEMBLY_ACC=CAM_ASM_000551 /TAXON_ID=420261 /ORGANISM="Thalassiosira antarctica, Strain CCMP982" /LENGTH=143 /DNA_ID=CAMNT_0048439883 /DNA_START=336 /DNA_END=768 /DNA_ORIENTATION=-